MLRALSCFAALAVVVPGCVQPPELRPSARVSAINGGSIENDLPATVLLADMDWMNGGLCSGSLIAPRVVVSAKHCFENRGNEDPADLADWAVLTGPYGDRPEDEFGIEEVLTTPGAEINNFDIEIVILDREVSDIEPYEVGRDLTGLRVNDSVTLCGYGENPSGSVGRKFSGEALLAAFGPVPEWQIGENELATLGAAACGGDSGGTVLDASNRLIGVIVRGATEDCGSEDNTFTAVTLVNAFLDLIDEGLQRTGICVPNGPEVCDGLDNDCDDQIDPGCADLFGTCARDDLCRSGVCRDVGDGQICTLACEPAVPAGSCPEGTYCREVTCGEAYCTAGEVGAAPAGEACDADTDCSTLRCRQDLCVAGCVPGQGQCQPGEVCATSGESCGSCLGPESVSGPRGLGEPCTVNDDCESGACANVPGDHYCTTRCDGSCPTGYHCSEGACLRGDLGRDGEPCTTGEECESGRCLTWPEGDACSSTCDRSTACPDGATCEALDEGPSACDPDKAILGTPCDGGGECFGGLCANWQGEQRCSETCDTADPCPTGFRCLDVGDGLRVCVSDAPPDEDDGGSERGCCRVAGRGDARGAWIPVGVLLLVAARRRRRRRR